MEEKAMVSTAELGPLISELKSIMQKKGYSPASIRDLLGHSDITTTEIYARADNTLKRQALEKASPLNKQLQYPTWTDDDDLMTWLNSFAKN